MSGISTFKVQEFAQKLKQQRLLLISSTESEFEELFHAACLDSVASPALSVRIIRGKRCTDVRETFHELAAALQFPYYFGQNWDAFEECLVDIAVLEFPQSALFISEVGRMLRRDSMGFKTLLEISLRAAHDHSLLVALHAARRIFSIVCAGPTAFKASNA